ncbi:MAG: thioredoxin [Eubacteriaceae bacterium]|nr:thioredoxin [Eubacteriaceae bacterium]
MKEKTRNLIGGGLLAVFTLMIALGAARGEIAAVMAKACAICLQCIGIG